MSWVALALTGPTTWLYRPTHPNAAASAVTAEDQRDEAGHDRAEGEEQDQEGAAPLGDAARGWLVFVSGGSVTDIFLPDWLSRRIPPIFGGLLLIGLVLHGRIWLAGRRSD